MISGLRGGRRGAAARRESGPAARLGALGAAVELAASRFVERRLAALPGGIETAYTTGKAGRWNTVAHALTATGGLGALLLRRSRAGAVARRAGPISTGLLRLGGLVVGLAVGAWVGGAVGGLVSRGLWRGKLGFLDRVLGSVAAAGTAVIVIWALATAIPMIFSPTALAPVTAVLQPLGGQSSLVEVVDSALPLPARALDEAVSVTASAL